MWNKRVGRLGEKMECYAKERNDEIDKIRRMRLERG